MFSLLFFAFDCLSASFYLFLSLFLQYSPHVLAMPVAKAVDLIGAIRQRLRSPCCGSRLGSHYSIRIGSGRGINRGRVCDWGLLHRHGLRRRGDCSLHREPDISATDAQLVVAIALLPLADDYIVVA